MSPPELSIVLPCYNESGNIPSILERYLPLSKEVALELILVDNGSTDNSREILLRETSQPEYGFAKTVVVSKNIGYGHGIKSGLIHCTAPAAGFSHADLQCPPEDTVRAYLRFMECRGTDERVLVKGRRLKRHRDEAIVSQVYQTLCQAAAGFWMGDINAQPKIFPRALIPELLRGPDDFSFDFFVLYRAGKMKLRIEEIDVLFEERTFGQSKWAYNRFSKMKTILRALMRILQIRFGKKWHSVT